MLSINRAADRAAGTNLADLVKDTGGETILDLDVKVGRNLGHRTIVFHVPIADLFRISIVANSGDGAATTEIAQRRLDPGHATKLAQFMLKGLASAAMVDAGENHRLAAVFKRLVHKMGEQPYAALQPIVANIRTAGVGGSTLNADAIMDGTKIIGYTVHLGIQDLLYIVDGQHRRKAMDLLLDFLEEVRRTREYPKRKTSLYPYDGEGRDVPTDEASAWDLTYQAARSATVVVEAHLGLTVAQERQLFYDLNALGKNVETSLGLEFDTANTVNKWVKEHLIETNVIRIAPGDKVDWDSDDTGVMTRKDLVAVNARLFLNKTNTNGANQNVIDEREDVGMRFWNAVTQIEGFGEPDARNVTVAAQSVLLKALAKLTFDFAFGKEANPDHLDTLLDGVTDIDLSHDNWAWRYYELTPKERQSRRVDGLANYLPPEGTGNRDIGSYDVSTSVMRFGAKHNDIFPLLGDMIRWMLKLPPRTREA